MFRMWSEASFAIFASRKMQLFFQDGTSIRTSSNTQHTYWLLNVWLLIC